MSKLNDILQAVSNSALDGERVEVAEYKAEQQIKDLFLELVGEDEAPDTMIRAGVPVKGEPYKYKPHYSLRAQSINQTKAELRQKIEEL